MKSADEMNCDMDTQGKPERSCEVDKIETDENELNLETKTNIRNNKTENTFMEMDERVEMKSLNLYKEKENFANKKDQSNNSDTDMNQYLETMTNSSKSKIHIKIRKSKNNPIENKIRYNNLKNLSRKRKGREKSDLYQDDQDKLKLNTGMNLTSNDKTKFDLLHKVAVNMFPKSNIVKHLSIENEDDNIPKEKSELRIIVIFLFITSVLCLVTPWQVVLILIKTQNPIFMEPIMLKEDRPFCKSSALINVPKRDKNIFS